MFKVFEVVKAEIERTPFYISSAKLIFLFGNLWKLCFLEDFLLLNPCEDRAVLGNTPPNTRGKQTLSANANSWCSLDAINQSFHTASGMLPEFVEIHSKSCNRKQ
ncbi:hypothetical protein AV530_002192 [Patagioenas fasciata monilis]|uniref:Uncharacterized protein n=1 Tax=Patagioenas fasciata monilis TaxID=372326 RepID=A0A1V4K5G4_PATFA|nr:hypothetical protein AV530_002192 [Patagioenas fasciata monilis]